MSQQAKTSPCPIKSQPSRPDPTPAHTCSLHDGGIPRALRLYAGVRLCGRRRAGEWYRSSRAAAARAARCAARCWRSASWRSRARRGARIATSRRVADPRRPSQPSAGTFTAATSPTRRSTSAGPRADRRSCSPTTKLNAPRLSVHVDPARPDSWRQEPYYSQIKRWVAVAQRGQVIVWQGRSTNGATRSRPGPGEVRPDQYIITSAKQGPRGTTLEATVVERTIRLHRR